MSESIMGWLPAWAQTLLGWLGQPAVFAPLVGGSVLLLLLGIVAVPLVLARMPADFLLRSELRQGGLVRRRSPGYWMLKGLKNALGAAFLVLGLLMMVLPGPGLMTVLFALLLLDFPAKRRLLRWILSRRSLQRSVAALRQRAGRAPLELPARR